ncbi:MAG: helix-turn-helix domain-containing protein [Nitrospiraceae bacterium]|nr:helix-turn-helix domain-containing protein [Nitrospiraceae bacterium]
MSDKLLSNRDAALFLGIAETTLPRWRWAGIGPGFLRVGRSIRYRLSDLENYLAERSVSTSDQKLSAKVG